MHEAMPCSALLHDFHHPFPTVEHDIMTVKGGWK